MTVQATRDATDELGQASIGGLIVKFAAPSVVAMVVMSLYNIVDQLFIGHDVGYLGNAATNVVFPVNVLAIGVSMLMGEGAVALYSINMGKGDREKARKCVGNAITMLAVIGVLFASLCLAFLQPVLGFFGATEAIMPYAVDYAAPIVFGLPFVIVGPGLNAFIRAGGSPGFAMKSMVAGAVLNTVLDPIFIFTLGMGVKGAAIATAVSQFVSFAVSVSFFVRDNRFGIERKHLRPDASTVFRIMACGASPSISQTAIMVVIVTLNKSLVLYGANSPYGSEIPLAAHGIAMKVNQILFSVLIGISMGAQPIIGYNFGAGNYDRVKKAFLLAVLLATGVGLAAFVVFFFFPQTIVGLFGSEEELYNEFAQKCFRIFLFFTALNGFTILSGTLFQSMARVTRAAAIQLSRQVLLMIPAVHILPLYYGIEGVLFAGPITDGCSFVLAFVLVSRELRLLDKKNAARDAAQEAEDMEMILPSDSARIRSI